MSDDLVEFQQGTGTAGGGLLQLYNQGLSPQALATKFNAQLKQLLVADLIASKTTCQDKDSQQRMASWPPTAFPRLAGGLKQTASQLRPKVLSSAMGTN